LFVKSVSRITPKPRIEGSFFHRRRPKGGLVLKMTAGLSAFAPFEAMPKTVGDRGFAINFEEKSLC
jgi:hypothetical protein